MRYPWANTVLLLLLVVQLVTGLFGLIAGAPRLAWVLWLHAAGGYAVLVVFVWKGRIIVDVLRRRRRLDWPRLGSLSLTLFVVVILGTGIIWTIGGPAYALGFSLITLHAVLALFLLVLFAWHTLAKRFIFRVRPARSPRVPAPDCHQRGGAGRVEAGRAGNRLLSLPGAARRFTGSYETGSLTGAFPTVSWLFDNPPPVAADTWRLVIDGAVAQPLTLTYDQIEQMAQDERAATIDCTGGWYSAQTWRGVALGRLLAQSEPAPHALSVTVEAVSGYGRRFALDEARGLLVGRAGGKWAAAARTWISAAAGSRPVIAGSSGSSGSPTSGSTQRAIFSSRRCPFSERPSAAAPRLNTLAWPDGSGHANCDA